MDITPLIAPERVICLSKISSKKRILEELSRLLGLGAIGLDPTDIFNRLIERERLGSTGLGHGVALPHARIMIHQPFAGAEGAVTDLDIRVEEFKKAKKNLNELLARHTGQPIERIEKDSDRDFFMGPEEACEYGIVDRVIESH